MTATCTNAVCPENGKPKDASGLAPLPAGERILCGSCGKPCTVTEAAPQ